MKFVTQALETEVNRRSLLRNAGLAGAGLFAGGFLAGCGGNGGDSGLGGGSDNVTDADVLNFALNLEYLEAEYYLRGVFGTGLTAADAGVGAGPVTGGRKVTFATPAYRDYATEIANDELAHVKFLRRGLGASAVARPAIDLQESFNTAAKAAGLGDTFDPFANEVNFLIGAFVFEDVGVTAYRGGSTLIENKTFLSAAAAILGVEAYHAGMIRTLINQIGGAALAATTAISNLRDSADGAGDKDQPVRVSGRSNIVPTDNDGLAFSRTTGEVLKIVYLGGTKGGFFPNGLNGTIK